ncbi:MAG: hypothetical protein K2O29_09080 [Ruminococcus sp.]|nr:hypothetical protein [Ruminococcus sp.]
MEEADDPELKQVMQDSLNYSNSLLKDRQAKMQDFIKQTGQDRDYFREQNYGKVDYRNQTNMDYMARFNPKFSDRKNLNLDKLLIPVKTVSNSKFIMFTDIDADRKNKAVRLIEKNLIKIQKDLPKGFEMPPVAVIDFDKHNITPKGKEAIGGYKKETGFIYINTKYDTTEKILGFVNKSKGYFANTTEYAPLLHELGHKYYEDSIKRLVISENISYNDAKRKINRRIYDYIQSKGGDFFVEENLSGYSNLGWKADVDGYTEIIAESFSVRDSDDIAKEILKLLE